MTYNDEPTSRPTGCGIVLALLAFAFVLAAIFAPQVRDVIVELVK